MSLPQQSSLRQTPPWARVRSAVTLGLDCCQSHQGFLLLTFG